MRNKRKGHAGFDICLLNFTWPVNLLLITLLDKVSAIAGTVHSVHVGPRPVEVVHICILTKLVYPGDRMGGGSTFNQGDPV